MRVGRIISLPDKHSQFARIKTEDGRSYTVDPGELPEGASKGEDYAFKVDIHGNDSGLAYGLKD